MLKIIILALVSAFRSRRRLALENFALQQVGIVALHD
jgi:hypothetical protein